MNARHRGGFQPMGFNKRKMEDAGRQEAEKEAAARENATSPCSRLIFLEIGSVLSQQTAARRAIMSVTATRLQERR
jgi:hypothetical protein